MKFYGVGVEAVFEYLAGMMRGKAYFFKVLEPRREKWHAVT
jgi:hypothetical protein